MGILNNNRGNEEEREHRMFRSSSIVCAVLFAWCLVVARSAQPCTFDYECGNVPYGYCDGGESDCSETLQGFGFNNGSIYYAQLCRTNGMYGNYTFKRIPIDGGVPVDLYTRQQIPAAVNPNRVLGLVDNYLFFDIIMRQPGRGIKSIDVTRPAAEGDIKTNSLPQSVLDFDPYSNTPATYLCNYIGGNPSNYTIEHYPIFPPAGTVSSRRILYTLSSANSCGVIKRYSDADLFFTSDFNSIDGQTTHFYRGSITCSNCAAPQPFFSVAERVVDFDIYNNYVFYGTFTGLYRVNLDGSGNVKLSANSESAVGVNVINGKVIYNNGMDIRSVDFQGNNGALLSLNKPGRCACRPGFSGADCSACTGQVQWQSGQTSRPLCVAYGSDGRPQSCFQDYQCGNPPYTVCYSNACTCFNANFTGSACNVCEPPRKASWTEYGYPMCA